MTGETPVEQVPARILNEHRYCPRLAYLMWVDGANADNAATLEGKLVHRRVDATAGSLPGDDVDRPVTRRSLTLGDDDIGVVARIDLVELDGRRAVPIEYKRGRPASDDEPLHEPELIQLLAQVVLLRAHDYEVDEAAVWFAGSRQRCSVVVPDDAEQRVRAAVAEVRSNAVAGAAPPPLVDSPKCPHCVLIGLCLPDESGLLSGQRERPPRRLMAADNPARPLYLTEAAASIRKRGGRLSLHIEGRQVESLRMLDISHVAIFGNGTLTSAAVRACAEHGVPVLWLTSGGWLTAIANPVRKSDTRRRIAQHRAHAVGALDLARAFVYGKIRNQRTLIRRGAGEAGAGAVGQLARLAASSREAPDLPTLLGFEGAAARAYFGAFALLLKRDLGAFDFSGRNRRPPRDPVNALLSFAYALLAKDATIALAAAGLDPYVGVFHRPGFARPALALDLMEEFRPLIADSVVVRAINNGEVSRSDFVESRAGAALNPTGRRKFLRSYERRMQDELRHPVFGYRASYRRTLEIQARMLAANMLGELSEYRSLTTR